MEEGSYRLQPVFVEDLAQTAVDAAQQEGDLVTGAAGPDVFTFEDMVHLVADKTGNAGSPVQNTV